MPALITGGDVHPSGQGVLLRTYSNVWWFPQGPGVSVPQAFARVPCSLPAPDEPQGEAIGWLASGAGYITTSEGKGAAIHRVSCSGRERGARVAVKRGERGGAGPARWARARSQEILLRFGIEVVVS